MGIQINGNTDIISPDDGSLTIEGTTNFSSLQVNSQNLPSAGPLSNRNIIINGSMQVAQRGTVTGVTGDNYGGPDRYKCFMGSAGTWTLSQQADAPSGTGLYYSYKFQCTSTGTLSSGSYLGHRMILEGYDSASLNGQQFTISFWVKCNKTGTMTCEPYDASSGATQSVSKQFTINAANTWEYKTITFPANPHNYPADSAGALVLHWWLSAGSTWNSTASTGEWTNFANGFRAYGCNIDLTDSTSNYFQITGIQLEAGTVATPFEHRSYGDELARCERYYQVYGPIQGIVMHNYNTNNAVGGFRLRETMRADPTADKLSAYNGSGVNYYSGSATGKTLTALVINYAKPTSIALRVGSSSAFTAGYAGHLDLNSNNSLSLSAEL